jgi:hypothetical protein
MSKPEHCQQSPDVPPIIVWERLGEALLVKLLTVPRLLPVVGAE